MGRKKISNEHFDIVNKLAERNILRISDYISKTEDTRFKCLVCNFEWIIKADTIRKNGCPNCAGNRKLTREIIEEKLKHHTVRFVSSNDIRANGKAEFQCKICSYQWETGINTVINHNTSCPRCSNKERITLKAVLEFIKDKQFTLESKTFKTSYDKVEWKCKTCKHLWKATISQIIHKDSGCPACAENPRINETLTYQYLKSLLPNTKIDKQVKLREKITIGKEIIRAYLFIDYVFEYKGEVYFVEYNGRQHYQPIDRFGGLQEYEKVVIRDNWLKQYCLLNNINLIEIDGRHLKGNLIYNYLKLILG